MTDKEFKDLEVGRIFTYKNLKLIVKEAKNGDCSGCFFYENRRDCEDALKSKAPACASWARKDKKNVVFVEVEDEI